MNFHFYVMPDTTGYTAYRNCDLDGEGIPHPLSITDYGETPLDAVLDLCAELRLTGVDWGNCDTN